MNTRFYSVLLCLLAVLATPKSVFAQQGPIRFDDVSFMIRGAVPESEILKEVKRRKLRAPLNLQQENSLHSSNASAAFVAALKSPEYNLPKEAVETLDRQDQEAQKTAQLQQIYIAPGSMEGSPGAPGGTGRYQVIVDKDDLILFDTQTGRLWERINREWFDAGPKWTKLPR